MKKAAFVVLPPKLSGPLHYVVVRIVFNSGIEVMISVKEIVGDDQKQLFTIEPESTVQAAITIMSSEKISALLVVEYDKLVGIISERDYVRNIASQRIPAWSVKIHEVMTKDVITVTHDDPIKHCMALMTEKRIRHLPVMDEDKLTAMISITDVVRALNMD